MQEEKRLRASKVEALVMLVSVPLGILVGLMLYIFRGGTAGVIVELEFKNCYVSILTLLVVIFLTVLAFLLCARLGANPIFAVSRNRLRFLFYILILAILGIFFLKTRFLSGRYFYLSSWQRANVALTNLLIVSAVGGAYLLVFPVWKGLGISSRNKVYLLVALLLWGYLFASGFRMLPLPYVVGVE